jgi:glutamine phosphoribosylpyrophosphate amidotransferase
VAGRRVILVDDVYTRGDRQRVRARVAGAGAEEVYVVTLARMM